MLSKLILAFAALSTAVLAPAQPRIAAVLNAASNQPVIGRDCWVSIYGSHLASAEAYATALPLPTTLAGASVFVEDIPAQLSYVSPNQINALIPSDTPSSGVGLTTGEEVTRVRVSNAEGEATHTIALWLDAPALYSRDATGSGPALVLSPEFRVLDTVERGAIVILYANCGHPPHGMELRIGDRPARVDYAGPAPGFAGVSQLNVQVPTTMESDRLFIRSPRGDSNPVQVSVPPAVANVAEVSGAIYGAYPADGTDPRFQPGSSYTFSRMPHVMRFTLDMRVLPGAAPFTVLAVGENGSARIEVNPSEKTWRAVNTVPTAPARAGDFSALLFELAARAHVGLPGLSQGPEAAVWHPARKHCPGFENGSGANPRVELPTAAEYRHGGTYWHDGKHGNADLRWPFCCR